MTACVRVRYLCQCLYAGVDVTARHLRDDKVDGRGSAVVEVIKVWRHSSHPFIIKKTVLFVTKYIQMCVFNAASYLNCVCASKSVRNTT